MALPGIPTVLVLPPSLLPSASPPQPIWKEVKAINEQILTGAPSTSPSTIVNIGNSQKVGEIGYGNISSKNIRF